MGAGESTHSDPNSDRDPSAGPASAPDASGQRPDGSARASTDPGASNPDHGDDTSLTWHALIEGSPGQRLQAARRLIAEARRREARLELWRGDQCLRTITLGEQRIRIGRDPCCELVADADGVSRVHAFVEKDRPQDRDWVLEDFNSANGVYWHDRRLRGIRLRHGDEVQLGSPLRDAPRLRYLHPRSPWEKVIHGIGLTGLIGSGAVVGLLLVLSTVSGGSRVDFIGGPVKIVSEDGRRVDAQEGAATAMPRLEDYPLVLRQALIASEDARFGWNSGLDLAGTLRSLVRKSGGGSGLTQQVARIYYPSWVIQGDPNSPWPWARIPEVKKVPKDPNNPTGEQTEIYPQFGTTARKLRELPVSWQLETRFDKNRILKMYLDRAYLGLGTNGFEQASRLYFRKSVRQLSASEAAYLVGLLPAPFDYSVCAPTPGQEEAKRHEKERELSKKKGYSVRLPPTAAEKEWAPIARRRLVLNRMREEGFISREQYRDAVHSPLITDRSACQNSNWISYPYFSDYATSELSGPRFSLNLDAEKEGGNWYAVTTINPDRQALAEKILTDFLKHQAAPIGISQAALISLNIQTGKIIAYVGGRGKAGYDRVQAERQPGSTFKLFTYLAALEEGVKPTDLISCARIFQLETGCHHGDGSLSMADGLAYSENPVALRLADRVGFDTVIGMARRLGISSTHLKPDEYMVLGGNEVFLYEMARAFAVVANGGRTVPMHGVERIYDLNICGSELSLATCRKDGIYRPLGEKPQQLLAPEIASQMDGMLRRAVEIGTGRNAGVVPDARGKTGTTNDGRDALFIGYSPSKGIVTGIWMGNDDNTPAEAAAGSLAAQLWGEFMSRV